MEIIEEVVTASQPIDPLQATRDKLHQIADSIRLAQKDKSVVMILGEELTQDIESISTGSFLLDRALGIGGFPKGRVTELYGSEGSGKTSISLSTIAQAQRDGIICAYIDCENAILPSWASGLGVDTSLLLFSQESCTQTVFTLVEQFIDNGVGLIVIDSVAAMSPREELEGDFGDHHVGLNARWIGQGVRKICEKIGHTKATVIFINQIREDVGIMFGNPEITPGGRSIKFAASIRLDVKPRGQIHAGGESAAKGSPVIGVRMGVTVRKNKVAPPFKTCDVDFYFDRGFDNELAIIDVATQLGLFTVKGGGFLKWISKEGETSKRRLDWAEYFRNNVAELKKLSDEVEEVERTNVQRS